MSEPTIDKDPSVLSIHPSNHSHSLMYIRGVLLNCMYILMLDIIYCLFSMLNKLPLSLYLLTRVTVFYCDIRIPWEYDMPMDSPILDIVLQGCMAGGWQRRRLSFQVLLQGETSINCIAFSFNSQ